MRDSHIRAAWAEIPGSSELLKLSTTTEVNVGDIFDAEIHEAISQIPAQKDSQKGKIIDIIQGGYKIGDNIITYPKVVVAQ